MNPKMFRVVALSGAVIAAFAQQSQAGIEIYNKDDTTIALDASFNAFFSTTSTETEVFGVDTASRDQSRIRSGFLPNWFGTTFSKKMGDVTFGGRASFWVSTNDSDEAPTDGLIDTRQFYGTVDAPWGQVLFGKDFTLFNRSNVFGDEILLGYGMTNDTLGLIDGAYVPFGNIGSGYIYPLPTNQITYRSPDMGGFKLAIGLVDPSRTSEGANAEESAPRIEGELTYNLAFSDTSNINAWVGFLQQTSESDTNEVDSNGISYGAKVKVGGLTLHASGYDGEGLGLLTGPSDALGLGLGGLITENGGEVDSTGYLGQGSYNFGKTRVVLSYGMSEIDNTDKWENETTTVAAFYSFNSNFTGVVEYTMNEITIQSSGLKEEVDSLAVGVVLNF